MEHADAVPALAVPVAGHGDAAPVSEGQVAPDRRRRAVGGDGCERQDPLGPADHAEIRASVTVPVTDDRQIARLAERQADCGAGDPLDLVPQLPLAVGEGARGLRAVAVPVAEHADPALGQRRQQVGDRAAAGKEGAEVTRRKDRGHAHPAGAGGLCRGRLDLHGLHRRQHPTQQGARQGGHGQPT
jgi:hypothetical protein